MSDLPCTMSAESVAWIEKQLCSAQKESQLVGLVPILGHGMSMTATDADGKTILGDYSGGFFDFGWDRPELLAQESGYVEVILSGFVVKVHESTIEKLRGRHLEFKTVKCNTIPDFEFLVAKDEGDLLNRAIRLKTLPKIG